MNFPPQSKTLKNNASNLMDSFNATDIVLATSLAIAFVTFLTLSQIAIV
ncbi:MAG: hypothetical protein AAGA60_21475 [Cyanobacteria bacterium P01_E01_bin.42]